jgi:hypothetical protein
MKKLILIGVGIALVVATSVYLYVFHKPARMAASEEAAYTADVKSLVAEFEANENAANAKYLNKVVKVLGTVSSVTENETELTVSLKEADAMSGVTCSFLKNSLDKSKVTTGSKVAIKGICSGYLMDVVLSHCALDIEAAK